MACAECAALRARAERAEEALREERDALAACVWAMGNVHDKIPATQTAAWCGVLRRARALLDSPRTNAGANRGGDAAPAGDARHRVVAKPADSNPDAADVVAAFFAEKEGR